MLATHRAVEGGVTEGEDPAVGGHEPVALARRGGRHAHDGLVEVLAAHRAVEDSVTKGEDSAVGGTQPVALARGSGRNAHDGLVEVGGGQVPDGRERPIREHLPERGDHAVAAGCRDRSQTAHLALGDGSVTRRRRWWWRCGNGRGPARLVVLGGVVVLGQRGGARRIHRPRRHAGHYPADNAADAGDLLVALAVAKLETARHPRVAPLRPTPARGPVTAGFAESPPAPTAGGAPTRGVAVHVVAGSAAVARVVRLPPATHDRVGRAVVVSTVDRTAELRPARTTRRTAAARARPTGAYVPVGRARTQQEVEARSHRDCTAGQSRAVDETAPRHSGRQEGRGPLDQCRTHASPPRVMPSRIRMAPTSASEDRAR